MGHTVGKWQCWRWVWQCSFPPGCPSGGICAAEATAHWLQAVCQRERERERRGDLDSSDDGRHVPFQLGPFPTNLGWPVGTEWKMGWKVLYWVWSLSRESWGSLAFVLTPSHKACSTPLSSTVELGHTEGMFCPETTPPRGHDAILSPHMIQLPTKHPELGELTGDHAWGGSCSNTPPGFSDSKVRPCLQSSGQARARCQKSGLATVSHANHVPDLWVSEVGRLWES